jgi:aspartate aminotransferase
MTLPAHVAANLALDQELARRTAAGQPVVNLGLGESRLPVPPALIRELANAAGRHCYGPVAGDDAVRQAAAGYFTRRHLPTTPGQVVLAPGSKAVLFALIAALPGDIILPQPSWVSYSAQALLCGSQVIRVPVPAACGGLPDPAILPQAITTARRHGHAPRILLLTVPDNPTGTTATPHLVRQVCEIAGAEGLTVIADEIYRDIPHDPARPYLSAAEVLPAQTVVTTGLSKSLALGGWRIGLARFPDTGWGHQLRRQVLAIASEIWSTTAAPMQHAAAYALSEPPEITAHLAAAARLHATIAAAVHRIVTTAHAQCPPPQGGFYVYPDFEPARPLLAARGITDAASLQAHLLDSWGIAVLGGHHFGDDPSRLRVRAATSQLYGDTTSQQWAALHADEPALLPHVARPLGLLRTALTALTSPARAA